MSVCERWLQLLALSVHMFLLLPARVLAIGLLGYCLQYGHVTRYIAVLYLLYLYWDCDVFRRGGRRFSWPWKDKYLELVASYFPIQLVQLADLPADKNYLMTCHPHNLLFFASLTCIATDFFKSKRTRGLRSYFGTLNFNFLTPLSREYYLGLGAVSVDESSLKYVLQRPGGGNLLCLIPGGSEEAVYGERGVYRILLSRRRGFCRVALQTGASLVPTFVFGEVDCFDLIRFVKGGWIDRLQQYVKRLTGVYVIPYKTESGIFTLPRRTPVTIVMGKPIHVEKKENPTSEEIEDLHSKYIAQLRALFVSEGPKYLGDPNTTLTIA